MKKIFASKCRVDVLKLLADKGETHITDIVRQTNSTWSEIDRNVKLLENMGIVSSRFCQNRRLIKLKKGNGKAEAVLKALEMLEMANLDQLII